jgi:hypothetical protein
MMRRHRFDDRMRRTDRNQQAVPAIVDHIAHPADSGRHDWQSAHHRFHQRERLCLRTGSEKKQIAPQMRVPSPLGGSRYARICARTSG